MKIYTTRLTLWLCIVILAAWPAAAAAAPVAQFGLPVTHIGNEFVEANVSPWGQFTIGTVQGDPGTRDDDQKRLMFGHNGGGYTSFVSARIIENGQQQDVPLYRLGDARPQVSGDAVTMQWQAGSVKIEQVLTPALNPYTNRPDTIRISLTATNTGSQPVQAGIRVMLDTMIGGNDNAPFFVPGTGNFAVEKEYGAGEIPAYWKAFEAEDYSPASLKGQGILTGFDATPPDRFVVARWPQLRSTIWDYNVDPQAPVGDSAVALYWMPVELAAGASTTWTTFYGLAGTGGGSAWFDAPVNITSTEPGFSATLWVSNLSDADFVGGQAKITLPAGLQLAEGETETKPMQTVPLNGGAQSVTWRLVGSATADADFSYSATVNFASGSAPLSAEASVHYGFVAATQTPVPSDTPAPTITPTPLPVAPAPAAPAARLPWWPLLLLLPLLALPLLWILLRRRPTKPATRVPPPHPPRPSAPPVLNQGTRAAGPTGADVTHGRKKK
jgi:hypothetical protein